MARKAFLLRIDDAVLAAVQQWADEDLRSLNGQIEYVLRQAALKRGMKLKKIEETAGEEEKPQSG